MYTAIHVEKKNGSIARLTLADTQGKRIEVTKGQLPTTYRSGSLKK